MHDQPSILTQDTPHPLELNQHSADVTFHASDSVSFHVHTQILSKASPFFAAMFDLPQHTVTPNSSSEESSEESSEAPLIHPVIDLVEDSKVLEPLLWLCYSVPHTELRHLDSDMVLPVLQAAMKYDVEQPVRDALTTRLLECVVECGLQAWAFGCRHGVEQVARGGAEALRMYLPRRARETLSFLPDMPSNLQGDGISSGQYSRLLQFIRLKDDSAAGRRVSTPRTSGSTSTSTAEARATHAWEDFSLLRPPKIATSAVTAPAPPRRKVFELLPFTDGENFPFLDHATKVRFKAATEWAR